VQRSCAAGVLFDNGAGPDFLLDFNYAPKLFIIYVHPNSDANSSAHPKFFPGTVVDSTCCTDQCFDRRTVWSGGRRNDVSGVDNWAVL
jgi:hypothetical protein